MTLETHLFTRQEKNGEEKEEKNEKHAGQTYRTKNKWKRVFDIVVENSPLYHPHQRRM